MALTFTQLTRRVAESARRMGAQVTDQDTGFIISAFLEGIIHEPEPMVPAVAEFLQAVADEVATIT